MISSANEALAVSQAAYLSCDAGVYTRVLIRLSSTLRTGQSSRCNAELCRGMVHI